MPKKLEPEELQKLIKQGVMGFAAAFLAHYGSMHSKRIDRSEFTKELLDKNRLGIVFIPDFDVSRKLIIPDSHSVNFQFDIRLSGMLSKINRTADFGPERATTLNNTVSEKFGEIISKNLEGGIIEIEKDIYECVIKANTATLNALKKLAAKYETLASVSFKKIEKRPRIGRKFIQYTDTSGLSKEDLESPGQGGRKNQEGDIRSI